MMLSRREFFRGMLGAGTAIGFPIKGYFSSPDMAADVDQILKDVLSAAISTRDMPDNFIFQMTAGAENIRKMYAGWGEGIGEHAAAKAAQKACDHPLLGCAGLQRATNVSVIISIGSEATLGDVSAVFEVIRHNAPGVVDIPCQFITKDDNADAVQVTVIACEA